MAPENIKFSGSLECAYEGCDAEIVSAELVLARDAGDLTLACANGHVSKLSLQVTQRSAVEDGSKKDSPPPTRVKTKISGVTFANPDGVSRQSLLQFVKVDDEIQIIQNPDTGYYQAKHAIGIIGSIKNEAIKEMTSVGIAEDAIRCRVTQITGGSEEKPTLGCNVELYAASGDRAPAEPPETPKNATSAAKTKFVFMDPNGRNIFHAAKYCSGMQNAKPVPLWKARKVNARACKKCASDYETPERK